MNTAETITAAIARAVEDARRRRNAALGTFNADEVERAFRKASQALDRFLANGPIEIGERDLIDLFDRVGCSPSTSPLSPRSDRAR